MRKRNRPVAALAANKSGEIFELEGYAAAGMAGDSFFILTRGDTIDMPRGGEIMLLPDRKPVLYNLEREIFETLSGNPFRPGERIFPVAAFNSPGYVVSLTGAFRESGPSAPLPLFSYAAAGWQNGSFRTAAICVDREKRQDLRFMKQEKVINGIDEMRRRMPDNRLRKRLEKCAMTYGCPAGKNFFLKRYEAPLPASRTCNARCLGCISLQSGVEIKSSQDRISFTPSPGEIAEVALEHIGNTKQAVVSFGQGCEGDPLMVPDVLEPAVRMIRSKTRRGTINVNTNGSRPKTAARLFDAGVDSMRISINSASEKCYEAYFRPVDYTLSDVKKSIEIGLSKKKFISINYLNCPGFTDTPNERKALAKFIRRRPINMIQWRNLNFDPKRYVKIMRDARGPGKHRGLKPEGIIRTMAYIRREFPEIKHGYFNPPKEKFKT